MKYLAILFALLIVTIIILADADRLPRFIHVIYAYPYGDKLGHFLLFGLLNFFVTRALIAARPHEIPARVALAVGLPLALLVGLEEFSQKLFHARTFDLFDLAASYLGLLAGGFAAARIRKRKPPV